MRIGFGLPAHAGADLSRDVTAMAVAAEAAGTASLWVYERVLWPHTPSTGMYGIPGLPWDPTYRSTADPLTLLALAAAVTDRVRLGTSVLIAPLRPPLHLARALATLQQVTAGRVIAGFGTGWSPDEYAAAGAGFASRGTALDEVIAACRALWAPGPVSFRGDRVDIDNAEVLPRPEPTVPIMLGGGLTTRALNRVADVADGWLPTASTGPGIRDAWSRIRDRAAARGRDADALELIPRANVILSGAASGTDRQPFSGTWDQVLDDLATLPAAGADEVVVDFFQSARSGSEQIDLSLEALDRLSSAGLAAPVADHSTDVDE